MRLLHAFTSAPFSWAQVGALAIWQLATPAGIGIAVGVGAGLVALGACALVSTIVLMVGEGE